MLRIDFHAQSLQLAGSANQQVPFSLAAIRQLPGSRRTKLESCGGY
jgi:hypothetical protein